MREKQRKQELAALRASIEARRGAAAVGGVKRPATSEEVDGAASKKKIKKGKPVQTKPWSQKDEAEEKKELRRLKKLKKVKAAQGAKGGDDGHSGDDGEDWKEAIKEQKDAKRRMKESGTGKSGKGVVAMTGMEEL